MTTGRLLVCPSMSAVTGISREGSMCMIFDGYCPKCGVGLVLEDETFNYEDETRLDWYHCPVCGQVYQADEQDKLYVVKL